MKYDNQYFERVVGTPVEEYLSQYKREEDRHEESLNEVEWLISRLTKSPGAPLHLKIENVFLASDGVSTTCFISDKNNVITDHVGNRMNATRNVLQEATLRSILTTAVFESGYKIVEPTYIFNTLKG